MSYAAGLAPGPRLFNNHIRIRRASGSADRLRSPCTGTGAASAANAIFLFVVVFMSSVALRWSFRLYRVTKKVWLTQGPRHRAKDVVARQAYGANDVDALQVRWFARKLARQSPREYASPAARSSS